MTTPRAWLLAFAVSTAAAIAQVDLHTVHVGPSGSVIVSYSKTFNTCAHLLTPQNQLVHTNNIFCTIGDYVTAVHPASAFNANLAVGNQVKLCNGNNYGQCSALLTVTGGPALNADRTAVSLQTGGTQSFSLEGGAVFANRLYLLLGSASGTTGFTHSGHLVPLNPDSWFAFTLSSPNTFPLSNSLGSLDPQGNGAAAFTLPPGLPSVLLGLVLHHAFVVLNPIGISAASNAWPTRIAQ